MFVASKILLSIQSQYSLKLNRISYVAKFQNNILFALHLVHLPSWYRFDLLPFLVHCCLRIRNFHRLRQRKKFVYQILVTFRIVSFTYNVLFMIFWSWIPNGFSWIHELPRCMHAFVFLDVVGSFCFVVGFPAASLSTSSFPLPLFHIAQLQRVHCGSVIYGGCC